MFSVPSHLFEYCAPDVQEWLEVHGRLTRFARDISAPIGPHTLDVCRINSCMVSEAADLLHQNPTQPVIILTRPPGHHASLDDRWYPYNGATDIADQRGNILNFELSDGTDQLTWLAAVESAVDALRARNVCSLVLALGFDVPSDDPLSTFSVLPSAFRKLGTMVKRMNVPTVCLLEGGYSKSAGKAGSELVCGLIT